MAPLEARTRERMQLVLKEHRLESLVDVKNPMDITPMATDAAYEAVIETLARDGSVDALVAANVPLSPVMQTLPQGILPNESLASEDSIAQRLPRLAARCEKPIVAVVDSGKLYDPLAQVMESGGLPVFRSADRAVWTLGKYVEGRLWAEQVRRRSGMP